MKLEVFSERQSTVRPELNLPSPTLPHQEHKECVRDRGTEVKALNDSCTLSNLLHREVFARKLN